MRDLRLNYKTNVLMNNLIDFNELGRNLIR